MALSKIIHNNKLFLLCGYKNWDFPQEVHLLKEYVIPHLGCFLDLGVEGDNSVNCPLEEVSGI